MWDLLKDSIGGILSGFVAVGLFLLRQSFTKGRNKGENDEIIKNIQKEIARIDVDYGLIKRIDSEVKSQKEKIDSISRDSIEAIRLVDKLDGEVNDMGKAIAGLIGTIEGLKALLQHIGKQNN